MMHFDCRSLGLLLLTLSLSQPGLITAQQAPKTGAERSANELFARENLVAWCIVPFDDRERSPAERAAMLQRLGIRHFAYDYRAQHIPTFDAEVEALRAHRIELTAWWFPTTLNEEARKILDVLKRHQVKTQLWVTGGGEPTKSAEEQRARVAAEAKRIQPIAAAAAEIGCSVALYNHGGWFGEPENQVAIIQHLKMPNVGIVYNLHHGHDHVERLAELMQKMLPHLLAVNLNGMVPHGDRTGAKIVPLGAGELDVRLLRIIRDSGYQGPVGILNHTQENAELRLQDNLNGLDWLLPQLDGKAPGPRPVYRTWQPPAPQNSGRTDINEYDPQLVQSLLDESRRSGDIERGVRAFTSAKLACINCHRIGPHGGTIGPELTAAVAKQNDEHLVESVLWPRRKVAPEFVAHVVTTDDGRFVQGYLVDESARAVTLKELKTGELLTIAKESIEDRQEMGTAMPDGLIAAMTHDQQLDLFRFLLALRSPPAELVESVRHWMHQSQIHGPAEFAMEKAPLYPDHWPSVAAHVNRDRIYDYYAKEAAHFRQTNPPPPLLPQFPGLDGGTQGHWGNQSEPDWVDGRWNETILGSMQSGIFRGAGKTVARGICVQLGDHGQLAACFDPDSLSYPVVWKPAGDRYLSFSDVRHGFMHGALMNGEPVAAEHTQTVAAPAQQRRYMGLYRHGPRVLFHYRVGDVEYLDAPWVNDAGEFERLVAPLAEHPLRQMTTSCSSQWHWSLELAGQLGRQAPFAVDTIPLPFDNPWKALVFCGGHAFLPDGSALIGTMHGDVWRVNGLDDSLRQVRWTRFASGLHFIQGVWIDSDGVFVLGRDRITRLHDRNGDGEADYYESYSDAFETSTAGHDFICGLERDSEGRFYIASGNQGLVRISADGRSAEMLATGFRNPDGLGLMPDGTVTVPSSEGDWTPASMICSVPAAATSSSASATSSASSANTPQNAVPYYGYGGPKNGQPPALPLVYLPRGLDNSSGGQVAISGSNWEALDGNAIHLSFGAGTGFLLLQDEVRGQRQGALMPLQTEFRSGAHRARFHPDGHLYVSGMAGWGSYTVDDGCFHRVRWNQSAMPIPTGFHLHENGVLLRFTQPLPREIVEDVRRHFAQCWNYRYSVAYGSPELSPSHPGTPGHDPLPITSAHVIEDDRTLFLEMPELQPVNQLHLLLDLGAARPCELFLTVHALDSPLENIPGYQPRRKTIAAHPILQDLALALRSVPNPWLKRNHKARKITLETAGNLTFATRSLEAAPGEALALTLRNPDVVPHNWALVTPGALRQVGEAANRLIADPDAVLRQYVPEMPEVLYFTDIVPPGGEFTIWITAPKKPGNYPFLCTFPGHWMVMNGVMVVR